MPADTEVTELLELGAEKVSGVGSPANGTPWLLLKAAGGNGVRADPVSPHVDSPEADAQESLMTKGDPMDAQVTAHLEDAQGALTEARIDQAMDEAAEDDDEECTKAEADEIEALLTKANYCGVEECAFCKAVVDASPLARKAKLKAKQRRALPTGAFALPDKRAYPIHDENHARAALSMLHNATPEEQKRIKAAVHRKYPGIEQSEKERVEKSPGVPDVSVATPMEHGHLDTGQSGLAGPATGGLKARPADDSQAVGGETPYIILAEGKLNPPNPPHAAKSWEIELVEKSNWVVLDPSTAKCPTGSVSGTITAPVAAPSPSEEEPVMTTVTKEELDAHIDERAAAKAEEILKAKEKEAKKAAKKAKAKKAKKKAKMPFMPKEGAEKNANNGGDVTHEHMEGQVHGEHPSNDVNSIPDGGHVDGQYVNKETKGNKKGGARRLLKAVEENNELLKKSLQRPRSGGPVLDGQPRGAFPASEGRTSGDLAKGTADGEIDKLQKSVEELQTRSRIGGPEGELAKIQLGQMSEMLTLARLRQGHEQGLI